jgi:hypothetical protein
LGWCDWYAVRLYGLVWNWKCSDFWELLLHELHDNSALKHNLELDNPVLPDRVFSVRFALSVKWLARFWHCRQCFGHFSLGWCDWYAVRLYGLVWNWKCSDFWELLLHELHDNSALKHNLELEDPVSNSF